MRIYTSASDPLDFCRRCAVSEATAEKRYGNVGDGPDGRGNCFGYDCPHPDYSDDPDHYRCHTCRRRLNDND
jgi:hypothetical protein